MTLRRFGDDYTDAFASAIHRRQHALPYPDCSVALQAFAAMGHPVVTPTELTAASGGCASAFSRLALLAWRAVDDAQDRFAQAATQADGRGAEHAVEVAASSLALVAAIRDAEQLI